MPKAISIAQNLNPEVSQEIDGKSKDESSKGMDLSSPFLK
jgi:hypothetical protein